MSVPFLAGSSKRATTEVVLELFRLQATPTLPFQLRNYVSPNTWEARVSALTRLASHYSRPTLEKAYLFLIVVLSFLVPVTTYYVTLQSLEHTENDIDRQIWIARFSCFAVTVAMWILLFVPVIIWKHLGKVRVKRLTDHWTKSDALSAPSYGDAPVWKAIAPGLFRDAIVLEVTVPFDNKGHFDRDSHLPPYIAVGDDALPPYGDPRMTPWSKDLDGGIKYGDLPIYTDKMVAV